MSDLYRFADLVVQSDIALSPLPMTLSGQPDCVVLVVPAGRLRPSPERWDHHWRSTDGSVVLSCARDGADYRLGMPGLVSFLIEDDGSTVTCFPHDTLPHGTLEHLLLDQVLPRILTHRGGLVLHAGGVAIPRGAAMLVGDSGAGKSTLCGEFARAGHPLLGDDGILVRHTEASGFEALATYPGLRLLPDPLVHLFSEQVSATPVAHYTDKRRLYGESGGFAVATGAEPLRALYVLAIGPTVEIGALSECEAFMALVRASFQLHLDDEARSRGQFERIAALLDGVPVRRLSYPREFACLGAVREAILTDVATLPNPAAAEACACR